MALKFWLWVIALVPAALGTSTDVPNQCPAVPGAIPVFYAHPEDCQSYFMCDQGVPVLQRCPDGTRWNNLYKTCVGYNTHYDTCTRSNPPLQCSQGATGLIPHPTSCQGYYNCSDDEPRSPWSQRGLYEDECLYPNLFDIYELKCKSYKEASCGPNRVIYKDPCDYLKNRCEYGGRCNCQEFFPTCVGFPDGPNEYILQMWSPYYIECKDERLQGVLYAFSQVRHHCGTHAPTGTTSLFSPIKKACVSYWETPSGAPTCDGKAPGQSYRIDNEPDVYYSCPDAKVSYCGLGNVFNESAQKCESSK